MELGLFFIFIGYFLVKFFGEDDWTIEDPVYNKADWLGAACFFIGIFISIISIIAWIWQRFQL